MNDDAKKFVRYLERFVDVRVVEEPANQRLTSAQFECKMLREPDGVALLLKIQRIGFNLDDAGVCFAGKRGGTVFYTVPNWSKLLEFVRGYREIT